MDFRALERPLEHLLTQLRVHPGEALVWCQGEAKAKLEQAGIPGRYRHELAECDTLVIWSAPPGRAELRAALEAAKPKTVWVYGIKPEIATPEAFLQRLAGLAKYALKRQSGRASLAVLAAATGQREIAARKGLDWLQAKGHILWEEPARGEALIRQGLGQESGGSQSVDPETLLAELQVLLEESAAFRDYFKNAPAPDLQAILR